MASAQAVSEMKVTPTFKVERWSAKHRWSGVAASVAILPIWGASALAMWVIDKLRTEEATVWKIISLWPGAADIPFDETTEHLRRRWASTGKRITVSTRLTDNS